MEYVSGVMTGGDFTTDINKRLAGDFGHWCVSLKSQSNIIDQEASLQELVARFSHSPEEMVKFAVESLKALLTVSYETVDIKGSYELYDDEARYDITMSVSVTDINSNVGDLSRSLEITESKIVNFNKNKEGF